MCPGKKGNYKKADKEEQYRRVFRHLDMDGDGRISAEELRRCVEMTEEEAEEAVRERQLGMEEFVKMIMDAEEEGGEDNDNENGLREAFKMYEEEDKGRITAKSLKRMLSRLGDKRSLGECKEMISFFDLDGDGVLSFHEFKAMMS